MARTRTTTTILYHFDELDERAKERARDWYRSTMESTDDWNADIVIDDAARLADLFGLNIRTRPVKLMSGSTRMDADVYYSVGDRDEGLTFSGSYAYRKGATRAVASEAPSAWTNRETGATTTNASNKELNDIVETLATVQRRNFYRITASTSHGRSNYHQMSIDVECDHPTSRITDDDIETVTQCLRDFASWACANLAREYTYQTSDECVDETIRANDYEFTEDGRRA